MTDSKSARSDAGLSKDPGTGAGTGTRVLGEPTVEPVEAESQPSAETRADPSSERCEVASEEACSCHLNQHFHAANHCRELSRLRSELDELRGKFTELESELAEAEAALEEVRQLTRRWKEGLPGSEDRGGMSMSRWVVQNLNYALARTKEQK